MYKAVACIMIVLLAGSIFAQQEAAQVDAATLETGATRVDTKALEREAARKTAAGDWESAANIYDNILKTTPVNNEAYLTALKNRAHVYKESGEPEKALEIFTASSDFLTTATQQKKFGTNSDQAFKTHYELTLSMAELHSELGDIEKARENMLRAGDILKQALAREELDPQRTTEFRLTMDEFNQKLGSFYEKTADLPSAIHTYEEAITQSSSMIESGTLQSLPRDVNRNKISNELQSRRDISYPLKLAELYEKTGEREKARQLYKEVRRAADRALTDDTYMKQLPEFQKELQETFDRVQEKLIEMEIY